MTKSKSNAAEKVIEFKNALYADAEPGPARMAFEKRRLIGRIRAYEAEKERPLHQRYALGLAVACGLAALVIGLGFFIFQMHNRETETVLKPIQLDGFLALDTKKRDLSGLSFSVPKGKGAKIVWPDKTTLWLGAGSVLKINSPDANAVNLITGRVLVKASKRDSDNRFVINTTKGSVTVWGTVFSVLAGPNTTGMRLYEGAISFTDSTENSFQIGVGEDVQVSNGSVEKKSIEPAGIFADLMIAEKNIGLPGPGIPKLGRGITMSPLSVTVVKPSKITQSVHKKSRGKKRLPTREKVDTQKIESPKSTETVPPKNFKDPELAGIEVEPLAKDNPIVTINQHINKGQFEKGVDVANQYLRDNPEGPYTGAVLYLKGYCKSRIGDLTGGRKLLETYLDAYPNGRYWDNVKNILGE